MYQYVEGLETITHNYYTMIVYSGSSCSLQLRLWLPMAALKYFDNHIYCGILSPLLYPMWIISLMNCSHKTLLLVLPASMFTSSTIASSFHSATSCSKLICSQIDCNKKYKNNYTLYQWNLIALCEGFFTWPILLDSIQHKTMMNRILVEYCLHEFA